MIAVEQKATSYRGCLKKKCLEMWKKDGEVCRVEAICTAGSLFRVTKGLMKLRQNFTLERSL